MAHLKVSYQKSRRSCTNDRLKKLKKLGYKTGGYYLGLESILKKLNYKYPQQVQLNGGTYFGYSIDGVQSFWLNYADACAEKIIYIHKEKKFKK